MQKKFYKLATAFLLTGTFLAVSLTALAATFDVRDVAGFQQALTTAQTNGEDDTINVSAGRYDVVSTLTYSAEEDHSLTIDGTGAGSTVLDGGLSRQIMNLGTTGTGNLTVSDMTFQNGRVSGDGALGGGLLATCDGSGSINIDNCNVTNNSSALSAAGAYTALQTGTVTVTNSTFDRNTIEAGGDDAGGIEIYIENGGNAVLRNNTFSNNTIVNTPGGSCDGAGVFIYLFSTGGSIRIENNTISGNSSNNGIGGLFCRIPTQGDLTVSNNTFSNNSSGNDSAGYGAGGAYFEVENGSVSITNNDFQGNQANGPEGDGGGLWVQINAGSIDITANTFDDNTADRNGGGASVYLGSGITDADIFDNVFANNQADSASGSGGGIVLNSDIGSVILINNTYYSNSASDGGGIGYYTEAGANSLSIYNEIYWNNSPNSIANLGVGSITAEYSDIQGGYAGEGNIDADPLFVGGGDYHLTAASPCIDAGTSQGAPATDRDTVSRPQGSGYDMGAYEYLQSSPTVRLTGLRVSGTLQLGGSVQFTANPESDTDSVYYRFDLVPNYGSDNYDPVNTWQTLQAFSTTNTCTYSFTQEGSYVVVVWAAPTPSIPSGAAPIIGGSVTIGSGNSVSLNSLSITPTGTVQSGDAVTFTAAGTDSGGGDVYYRFDLIPNYGTSDYDPNTVYTTVQDFSTQASTTHTFSTAGSYIMVVWASESQRFPEGTTPIMGGSITVE
jgi:hypothetical protein